MNYYRRYVGDYLRDTAHLSLLEHGAYTLLLDHYYSAGKSLPAGLDALYRICSAMQKSEQAAVRSVIEQFFTAGDDGCLHNLRADLEITKAEAALQKQRNSGVESANKRWSTYRSTHESTHRSTGGSAMQPPTTNHQEESKTKKEHVGIAPKNGARHAHFDDSPVVQTLPLREGGDFEFRQSLLAELEPLYPSVDVAQTVNEMKGWLIGRPDRRKTRRGIKRFITTWLASEQEKANGT